MIFWRLTQVWSMSVKRVRDKTWIKHRQTCSRQIILFNWVTSHAISICCHANFNCFSFCFFSGAAALNPFNDCSWYLIKVVWPVQPPLVQHLNHYGSWVRIIRKMPLWPIWINNIMMGSRYDIINMKNAIGNLMGSFAISKNRKRMQKGLNK